MKLEVYVFPDPEMRQEWEDDDVMMEEWWLGDVEKAKEKIPKYYPLIARLEVPMDLVVKFMAYLGGHFYANNEAQLHQLLREFLNFLRLVGREEEAREMLPYTHAMAAAAVMILDAQNHYNV
ncbi:uncharacterized protein [Fopius arisanus]|uniref:Uncharacterized protein isoform X1 n=1 Tax=Fopius arisanus TaxID=64838 RepID=A0A9R1U988_9HYME|nr:PREDICTED: uncharacterized protein LOC105272569 isoform X1 [Fopius arisanus]XP_011313051.1 PREDICTED: uncharacterized protein LOC105272569 isoform X2 [Fopius arisanus]